MATKENQPFRSRLSGADICSKTWAATSSKAPYPSMPVFEPLSVKSLNTDAKATLVSEFVNLNKGALFTKIGRHGKPHLTLVRVTEGLTRIAWSRKNNLGESSTIPLTAIERIVEGCNEGNFHRFKTLDSFCCFSIVTAKRTLDLKAPSAGEAQRWIKSLRSLVDTMKQAESGVPFNVAHVTHVDGDYKWSGAQTLPSMFRLVEKLGQGSFGSVYRAVQYNGNLTLAIKILSVKTKEESDDFRTEIDILKQLRHPNIVAYYGCYGPDDQNRTWLLMDYCAGGSLGSLLDFIDKPLTEDQIAYICASVLHALEYLHGKKITHGDIKSTNLLLSANGEIKLADFGVSKQKHETSVSNCFGDVNICGSALWMAPELLKLGSKDSTAKVDIWALGITCFELTQRFPPYSDLPAPRAIREIISEPAPKLNDSWSATFRHFVAQCLTRNAEDRPTAGSLLCHDFVKKYADNKSILQTPIQVIVKQMTNNSAKADGSKPSVLSRVLHRGPKRAGNFSCDFASKQAGILSTPHRRSKSTQLDALDIDSDEEEALAGDSTMENAVDNEESVLVLGPRGSADEYSLYTGTPTRERKCTEARTPDTVLIQPSEEESVLVHSLIMADANTENEEEAANVVPASPSSISMSNELVVENQIARFPGPGNLNSLNRSQKKPAGR